MTQSQSDMEKSARRLAESARTFVAVAEHAIKYGALTHSGSRGGFKGCDQARALLTWAGASGYGGTDAADLMDEWAADYDKRTWLIISGELENCDPACVKIILNGGFVAILAERLANVISGGLQ